METCCAFIFSNDAKLRVLRQITHFYMSNVKPIFLNFEGLARLTSRIREGFFPPDEEGLLILDSYVNVVQSYKYHLQQPSFSNKYNCQHWVTLVNSLSDTSKVENYLPLPYKISGIIGCL